MSVGSVAAASARVLALARRRYHTLPPSIEPAFDNFAHDLSKQLPRFPACSQDVEVLRGPKEFYKSLLSMIRGAKRQIFLSTLYLGKEERELITTLHESLRANSDLRLVFLLDQLRSTREHPRGASSASLLGPLQAAFPTRVDIRLFHTPELYGLSSRLVPKRFNEGWGLQHMKIYGADDDVMLSGANLSHDYFTNRQDRYIRFSSHAPLAEFFRELVVTTGTFSTTLRGRSTASSTSGDLDLLPPASLPSPTASSTTASDFKAAAREAFGALTDSWRKRGPASNAPMGGLAVDTVLFPVLQMGSFGIKQETDLVVPGILRLASEMSVGGAEATLDWTSGYFSMLREYKEAVLNGRANVRIVAAAPEANGFYRSKGVSKYIPPAYTYLERLFHDDIVKKGKADQIELREWSRPGWTYHAKGIWLTPPSSPGPHLTMIGSSNYGRRSARRDLEASLLVCTKSAELRRGLKEEVDGLREWAGESVGTEMFEREDRKVAFGVVLAARALRDKL